MALAAVIPARDEASAIQPLLAQVLRLPVALVIPVLNGCTDMTATLVGRVADTRVKAIEFGEALGHDVPRIAGAQAALEAGARGVIFVDGDLSGSLFGTLLGLINPIRRGELDLALIDCYRETPTPHRRSTAASVYQARQRLNEALARPDLGVAIPSHGPVAVSRRLLEALPWASVGVPPLMQAYAELKDLRIGVVAGLPHKELGSARRDTEHRRRIAETIIGDCEQAICLADGRPLDRHGHDGYHSSRRFDLLGLRPPEELTVLRAD